MLQALASFALAGSLFSVPGVCPALESSSMRQVVCRRASSVSDVKVWEERFASIEQFSKAWPEPKSPQVQRQLRALSRKEPWLEREFSRPNGSKTETVMLQVKYYATEDTVRQSAAPKRRASTFVRGNAKRARSKFSLDKSPAEGDDSGMPSWEPVDEQLDDDAPAKLQMLSKFACAKFSCSYAAFQLSQQQLPDQAAAL